MEANEAKKIIDGLSSSQMISWKHVNIHGEYDFDLLMDNEPNFSIDNLPNICSRLGCKKH